MTDTPIIDPAKRKARDLLNSAVRWGRMFRPKTCPRCGGSASRIEGHHHRGYEFPLDVMWLCAKCHFREDRDHSGEKNGRAKLTSAAAASIRLEYRHSPPGKPSAVSARALGRKYGVSESTIRRVVVGEIWQ